MSAYSSARFTGKTLHRTFFYLKIYSQRYCDIVIATGYPPCIISNFAIDTDMVELF